MQNLSKLTDACFERLGSASRLRRDTCLNGFLRPRQPTERERRKKKNKKETNSGRSYQLIPIKTLSDNTETH